MNKKIWIPVLSILAVLVIVLGILLLTGKSKTTTEDGPVKTEEGTLIEMNDTAFRIITEKEEKDMIFVYDEQTVNNNDGEYTLGDVISVDYVNKGSNILLAKEVSVVTKFEKESSIIGAVVETYEDEFILLTDSDTYVFTKDKDTKITGNLSAGDIVSVCYENSLTALPKATIIEVLYDYEEPAEKAIKGVVNTVEASRIGITVDSSNSYAVAIDANTKITGKATVLKPGYYVTVKYTGTLKKDAKATQVEVINVPEQKTGKIAGVVKEVSGDNISITNTEGKTYAMKITANTQKSGIDPAANVKIVATYLGELDKTPEVTSMYCYNDEPKPDPKPVVDPMVKGQGTIIYWNEEVVIYPDNGNPVTLTCKEGISIAPGYEPKVGDTVKFEYNSKTMELCSIDLVEKAPEYFSGKLTKWDKKANIVVTNKGDELSFEIAENVVMPDGYTPTTGDFVEFKLNNTDQIIEIRPLTEEAK